MTNINQFPPLSVISTNDLIAELRDRLAGMSDTQRKFYLMEILDGYAEERNIESSDGLKFSHLIFSND